MIGFCALRTMLLISGMVLFLVACDDGNGSANSGDGHNPNGNLTIFAAASLTDAFEEMREGVEAEHPELSLTFNFAGSSALRTQLEEGAQADVFASANAEQMDLARDAGRIASDPEIFARNQLVVIVPADNPAGIESLAELADPDILLVLAQEQVPAGEYTRRSLELMSQDPEFGDDFAERVLENLVSEEANVRSVATKVRLGEADAGIVYVSDVTDDLRDDVIALEIPEEFNVLAEYPVAIVEGAPNAAGADAFVEYLVGPEGQDVLEQHGFIPIDE
jgi:molybdate transport system substrate-binding protein